VNSTVDFSLAEVDLAFRATYFLGAERSEWAKMVTIDRRANGRKNDISLVNYLVDAKEIQLEFGNAEIQMTKSENNQI